MRESDTLRSWVEEIVWAGKGGVPQRSHRSFGGWGPPSFIVSVTFLGHRLRGRLRTGGFIILEGAGWEGAIRNQAALAQRALGAGRASPHAGGGGGIASAYLDDGSLLCVGTR